METDTRPPLDLRPAPVLAGVGTFLLTAASVSFVSARWDRFGPGDRFASLLAFSMIVFGLTVVLRRMAPATVRSLDVLMAVLVPVDVAALAIVAGATWPTVLLAAGPATLVSAEVLRRRDPTLVAEAGTVVGGVLAMCGVAAHYDVALAPLVATIGLLGCVVTPWNRERAAGPSWALLAGLAPALRVLDDAAFTGGGVLRRLGLIDTTPWEATLVAGALAATALATVALTRRSLTAGVGGGAVVVATSAAMWAAHQPPRSLLVVAAAIVVALTEMALTHRRFDHAAALRRSAAGLTATVNGALTVVVVAFAAAVVLPGAEALGPEWVYVAVSLCFAWVVADLRRMRDAGRAWEAGGGWAPATWGAVATFAAGTLLAIGATVAGLATLALGVLVLATSRSGRVSVAWTAGVVAPLLLVADWRVAAVGSVLGVALISLAAVVAHRDHDELIGRHATAGLLVPALVAATAVGEQSTVGVGVVLLGLAWLAAVIVDVRMPGVALGLRGLGLVAASSAIAGDPTIAALVLLASSVAWLAHLAATRQPSSALLGLWSFALGLAVLGLDVIAEPTVVFAATAAAVGISIGGWGVDHDVEGARVFGGFVIWWSSLIALVGADVGSLEPYLYPVLLALGWVMARDSSTSRGDWLAVGVPLFFAAVIAFGQRIDGGAAGHTVVLGVVALAVCAVGAARRTQPALVLGAAVTVGVGAFEALDRVVGIESWSWLVVSGAAALTIAATLELTETTDELVP